MRKFEDSNGLVSLSANFTLYGNISSRMMRLAASLGPEQEVYSIDECFIGGLHGVPELTRRACVIRARIQRSLGLPCCIGIAPTKTLAKLCNHIAKDAERKPGSYPSELMRVCNWQEVSAEQREQMLKVTPAGNIWGIGKRIAKQFAEAGIHDRCLISVDRSVQPEHGDVVVAAIDGEFTVKQLCIKDGQYALKPANDNYPFFEFKERQTLEVWGVVMAAVTELHRP